MISKIKKMFRKKTKITKKTYLDFMIEQGLVIGKTSIPTTYTREIDSLFPWLIEIGEHVIVSTNVSILAHDASGALFLGYSKIGRVIIGNNVYIGHGSTILCGTTIGDNVIVGANSLVNNNLEPNSVYAGVPAKKICSLDEFVLKHTSNMKKSPIFKNDYVYWGTSTIEEKKEMKNKLKVSTGYIKSREIK